MTVHMCRPLVQYNLSGAVVAAVAQHFCVRAAADVTVLHDDLDVKVGTLKWKQGGAPGGSNGVKSVGKLSLPLPSRRLSFSSRRLQFTG
jgi:PTH1 family peptidyl-tRNA hydrolase